MNASTYLCACCDVLYLNLCLNGFSGGLKNVIIDSSATRPVPMPGDSFAVPGNRHFLVHNAIHVIE